MLEFEIEKRVLSDILDVIGAFVDEAVFEFQRDGLQSIVVDPANVALASVTVGESEFETYEASGEVLGVNLSRLADVINLAASGDDVVRIYLNDTTNHLTIEVNNVEYRMAPISPDSIADPERPDLAPSVEFELNSDALIRCIDAAEMVSDAAVFEVEDDEFTFVADGDSDSVDYEPNEDEIEYHKLADECQSAFAMMYLLDMKKTLPKGETVQIELGDEIPVQFKFDVSDHTTAEYLVAPRLSS